jgi:hypothetical protein
MAASKKRRLPGFLPQDRFHSITNRGLHELITAIKKSKSAIRIRVNGVSIINHLESVSTYAIDRNSVPNLVKGCVLKAGGITGNPADLPDDTEVSDIIDSSPKYVALQSYLNAVVKHFKPTAKLLTKKEVKDCTTVKDCIDIVTERIS